MSGKIFVRCEDAMVITTSTVRWWVGRWCDGDFGSENNAGMVDCVMVLMMVSIFLKFCLVY